MSIDRKTLLSKVNRTLRIRDLNYNADDDKIANTISEVLEETINEIAYNTAFAFNKKKAKLSYYDTNLPDLKGYYKYNKPSAMLNLLAPGDVDIVGEFIYSKNKDQEVEYNQRILLSDMPSNIINYIRYQICVEMAMTYPIFSDRLSEFLTFRDFEYAAITNNERPAYYNRIGRG